MTHERAPHRGPRWFVMAVFAATGLVGPTVRVLLWPPSQGGLAGSAFIHELVFLTCPSQVLAPHEQEDIRNLGVALVVGVNVLLFAIMGVIASLAARTLPLYVAFAGVVFTGLFMWALFGAGFDLGYVHWGALLCASLVYAIPFVFARRAFGRG